MQIVIDQHQEVCHIVERVKAMLIHITWSVQACLQLSFTGFVHVNASLTNAIPTMTDYE